MNYAHVINDVAVNVSPNPLAMYTPVVASLFEEVPYFVVVGSIRLPKIVDDKITPEMLWQAPGTEIEQYKPNKFRYVVRIAPKPVFAPEVTVPASITMLQLRLALFDADKIDGVQGAINSLGAKSKGRAQIHWDHGETISRKDGFFVTKIAPRLDLTPADVDALFVAAAKL